MFRHKRLQLPQHMIQMKTHRVSGSFRTAQYDCAQDLLMLGEGPLHTAGFRKQCSTHPLEMRTDGVEDFAERE